MTFMDELVADVMSDLYAKAAAAGLTPDDLDGAELRLEPAANFDDNSSYRLVATLRPRLAPEAPLVAPAAKFVVQVQP